MLGIKYVGTNGQMSNQFIQDLNALGRFASQISGR